MSAGPDFVAACQDLGQAQGQYTGMDKLPHQGKEKTVLDGCIDKLMRHKTLCRRPTPQTSPPIIGLNIFHVAEKSLGN